MNALQLLKTDHRTVETLFKQFEKAKDNGKTKRRIVDTIIQELSVHAAIEEKLFYPAVRAAVANAKDELLESYEEHHIVKWTLSELEKMEPEDERFDAKVAVLMESIRHHVKEEEKELFPKVRKKMTAKQLRDLGLELEQMKKSAPRRPAPEPERMMDAKVQQKRMPMAARTASERSTNGRNQQNARRGRGAAAHA